MCIEKKIPWAEEPGGLQSMGSLRVGHDCTFTFHFYALENEMVTLSSVLAWRIPGTGEPDGPPSLGSHRVGHDRSDLAAAAEKKKISLVCFLLPLKRDKMSDTCRLFPLFGDPWPSCLLPSQLEGKRNRKSRGHITKLGFDQHPGLNRPGKSHATAHLESQLGKGPRQRVCASYEISEIGTHGSCL